MIALVLVLCAALIVVGAVELLDLVSRRSRGDLAGSRERLRRELERYGSDGRRIG